MCWRVAPQLVVLWRESLETSGGRIQMEEVDTWSLVLDGIDLKPFLFSPSPLPVCQEHLPRAPTAMMFSTSTWVQAATEEAL